MTDAVTNTLAATTETSSGEAVASILHNPETWIIVSFVLFIAIFAKLVLPFINKALDGRANTIREQLEQASRLRAEAQALLASYQAQQAAMLKEAEAIVATAQRDAAAIRARAAEDLKQTLDRRTQQAQEKIARAEAEAINQIRTRIVETAVESARVTLAGKPEDASDARAVSAALTAIAQQIH